MEESNQNNQIAEGLPSSISLLKSAADIYNQYFWNLVGIYAASSIIANALSLAASHFGQNFKQSLHGPAPTFLLHAALPAILTVLMVAIALWGQAALLIFLQQSPGGAASIKISYRLGWSKIWPLFLASLLSGLITAGGLVLLIIPGVIFAVWLSQAVFVATYENPNVLKALAKSKQLVEGRWWSVFDRLLVILLLLILVSSLANAFADKISAYNTSLSQLVPLVIDIILTPFFVSYSFLLYRNLKK